MLSLIDYELEGVKQWLKIADDHVFEDIGNGWKHYKEVFQNYLRGRNVAVQAGGYCGIFPRCMSQMFKTVYTFEPDPINFHCLVYNNPIPNVVKFQAALGEKHEMISMHYINPNNAGEKRVYPDKESYIPTLRIDDLYLSHCDLIMLDVEGYEMNALRGSIQTLLQFRPVVSVEDTNERIDNYLFGMGYRQVATVFKDTIYAP